MAAANKKQERISAVRFVHYFSDKHPHGTLAVSGENFKGTFCRLIPCKIDAEGKKYGNYHNHILYMETRSNSSNEWYAHTSFSFQMFLTYSVCEFENRKNFWTKTVISCILRHKKTFLLKYIVFD